MHILRIKKNPTYVFNPIMAAKARIYLWFSKLGYYIAESEA